jgi:geranylgeranyl reductase family protein
MNRIDFDVIVVGGGPSGTAAAIDLAKRGVKVCLMEKETHPRYKVCGGGVLARAIPLMPVQIEPVVEETCKRVEMHIWGKKLSFSGERDRPIIYMVMRPAMDALLLEEAKRCGVTVMENTQAGDPTQEETLVTVQTEREQLSARFLIAADGVSSVMAQKGGWPVNSGAIPSMECEVAVDSSVLNRFAGTARFDLDHPRGGYAWVFPKKDHLSVGVLTMDRRVTQLRESFHEYLDRLGIKYSPPLKLRGAMIPVKPRPGSPVKGRILLVGDAAGLAEPICAEGISNSLRSGILAAKAISEGGMEPNGVASIYERDMEKHIYGDLRTAALHARIMYGNPLLRNLLFRGKGETFCNRLIDVMMGEMDFSSLGGPLKQLFS